MNARHAHLLAVGLLANALVAATANAAAQSDPHTGHAGHASASTPPPKPAEQPLDTRQPRTPIPPVSTADRAAAFPELHAHMAHGKSVYSYLLFNRLEAWDADLGRGLGWEASAWLGNDLDRLWLRSEGERVEGALEHADLEALYGRSLSPWWDAVLGLKHDFKPGPAQDWLAFGMQGLAPYKFEVQATAYLGQGGRSALNLEAEYELKLSQRWVLQPMLEADVFDRNDAARGQGAGLASAELGLRLRYELTRQFAPYLGLIHERSFGRTSELRAADGEATRDTRWVAGLRFWF